MTLYRNPLLFSVLITVGLFIGCADEQLGPQADKTFGTAGQDDAPSSKRVFVGRDSFGVALHARVFGSWSEPISGCKNLTGTGTATHLGRITVDQQICTNSSHEITGGKFSISGTTGGSLTGTYLPGGTLSPMGQQFRIVVENTITGGNIRATQVPTEFGKATMTGILQSNGEFSYEIDGWLLHHVRDE